ncbi:arginine-hydroxylase NDUFAF5, mitochondrial-like [Xenia sp. Carnegie-2017]|uniref:arginine-hydroxylase NDUFAF5, mitochondrial-like n=1 Tax=Xenia sp. Carnegie-2017 TaxID=2897299 RepID=UPI001F04692C|nr:arginine-hydroxylase NDUFAF5, mitochondrial-like [Xenia sp. Carnegie-2017]
MLTYLRVTFKYSNAIFHHQTWKLSRHKATNSPMNVFNRQAKRLQKNRASLLPNTDDYDYLKDEAARRLVDRLSDVSRKFPLVLDLGCNKGHVAKFLTSSHVTSLVQCDMSEEMLKRSFTNTDISTKKLVIDEEFLPFWEGTFDAILSSLSLHWVNDLPGVFRQVNAALKDDGMFLMGLLGGETLFELRCSLQLAEIEVLGGFGPHISPFTQMTDIGDIASRAGFSLITVDYDEIIVNYPSIYELMDDLRGMGESNASWSRKHVLRYKTTEVASRIYREMYGGDDGNIPATFQILFLIAWKPSEKQTKPAERGSGTFSLKDIDQIDFEK